MTTNNVKMENPIEWIAREFSEDITQALVRNPTDADKQNEAVKRVIYRAEGHAYWQGYQDAAMWAEQKISVSTIEQNLLRAAKEAEVTVMIPYAYSLGVRAGLRSPKGQDANQTVISKIKGAKNTIKRNIIKTIIKEPLGINPYVWAFIIGCLQGLSVMLIALAVGVVFLSVFGRS